MQPEPRYQNTALPIGFAAIYRRVAIDPLRLDVTIQLTFPISDLSLSVNGHYESITQTIPGSLAVRVAVVHLYSCPNYERNSTY